MLTSMSEQSVKEMFNAISPSYDRVNRILSLGIDKGWRKKMRSHLPPGNNLSLLDLATGTADQLLSLMEDERIAEGVGIDLAEEMLVFGQKKVIGSKYKDNITLKVGSALAIPSEEDSFDCVTISFGIRNVQDPSLCLSEMHRVLKPCGRALILEFSLPTNRLVRSAHLLYLRRILPFVGGIVSGKRSAYSYLNKTIEAFPYGKAFCHLMEEAGFDNVRALPLSFGIATLYLGEKA